MKVIRIPLSAGALTKKNGLEKGPGIVADKIKDFFLKESGVLPFIDIEEVEIDNSSLEDAHRRIYEKAVGTLCPAIFLGGDHSMTYPIFKAFSKQNENPGILVFDAHPDMENDFLPPTHEDYLRMLIKEGYVKKENVIVVGVRNFSQNELEFWKKNNIKVFPMKEISSVGKAEVADAFMSVAKNFSSLYISIDIDVIDPAFAPGTGYTEPGGLTSREMLYFIQRLRNLRNIKMWDLVEVNPDKDINGMTAALAAKLIVEMS